MTIGESPFQSSLSTPAAVLDAAQPAPVALAAGDRSRQFWKRADEILDFLGDRLNPILVKEARQAMKSKQFSVTFTLLLIVGWIWTVLFIAFTVPGVYYAPWGMTLLGGYYIFLSIPLLIVVPFAAFRSLAAETEDGTFELLSITSLNARQIVAGKLGSAVLQMLVYYSALAPCIAFTYLLKGVDIITIGLLLLYTFIASVMLAIVGLVAATVTRSRHWQVLISVLLVMGLLFFALIFDWAFFVFLAEGGGVMPYDDWEFWAGNVAAFSFCAAFGLLFLFIAAGQITFASENRSTRIRYVLLGIQALLIAWCVGMWRGVPSNDSHYMLWTMVILAGIYWMVCGSLMCGENAQLSPRAKRELPQSILGRVLFTWFNPGSGSGYTFAVLNLLALIMVEVAAFTWAYLIGDEKVPIDSTWLKVSVCVWGYVAGYMGFVRLLVSLGRRLISINMLAAFLFQVVFALMGLLVPLLLLSIQSAGDFSYWNYSELQIPNWFWTLLELTALQNRAAVSWPIPIIILLVGGFIFLVNLFDTAFEVEQTRTLAPQRVLDDDAAHRPQAIKRKKNPWDEG